MPWELSERVFDSFHTRSVTGVKLVTLPATKDAAAKTLMVSTSMDKSLRCVDIATGESVYSLELEQAPICMDTFSSSESGNSYICVGTIDGQVLVKSAKNGRSLLSFQADDRVRSIHFASESIIVTGGNSGCVKRWDLNGEEGTSRVSPPSTKRKVKQQDNRVRSETRRAVNKVVPESARHYREGQRPTSRSTQSRTTFRNTGRFIDFYFRAAIENQEADGSFGEEKGSTGTEYGGGRSSRGMGRTTTSPTVEKAASAMRTLSTGPRVTRL